MWEFFSCIIQDWKLVIICNEFFSFRCVIAELFSEGNKLFDLSELLAYKKGDYDPRPSLEKIEDNQIRVRKQLLKITLSSKGTIPPINVKPGFIQVLESLGKLWKFKIFLPGPGKVLEIFFS